MKRLTLASLLLVACSHETPSKLEDSTAKAQAPMAAEAAKEVDMYEAQDKWPGACQNGGLPTERQSPIALSDDLFKGATQSHIKFAYKAADAELIDNGHTLMYKFKGDAGSIEFEGKKYSLKQFHFHSTSEHSLNGKLYDMEVHFVHMNDDKEAPKAVALGYLIQKGKGEGAWAKLWKGVPLHEVACKAHADHDCKEAPKSHGEHSIGQAVKLDATSLVAKKAQYLAYEGSLTTPNCDEIVTHVVSTKPIVFDEEAITKYASYHKVSNRVIQPLGDAKVRKYRKVSVK